MGGHTKRPCIENDSPDHDGIVITLIDRECMYTCTYQGSIQWRGQGRSFACIHVLIVSLFYGLYIMLLCAFRGSVSVYSSAGIRVFMLLYMCVL